MAPRTKSCAQCRRNRIKCDATLPQCRMCMRFSRQCSGLEVGPLMVDMTKTARYGMQKRSIKVEVDSSKARNAFYPQYISSDQIGQQAMVIEAFYGRFLSYWAAGGDERDLQNKSSWLQRLPRLSTDGSNDTLTLAIYATASSYCAVEADNLALTHHAWKLYGHAVQTQSRSLTQAKTRAGAITIHMISISVLFSLFEAMQVTNADAYRLHIYGTAKMFEVTDPQQCTEGVLCQIFFHVRTQMVFLQLTSKTPNTYIDVPKILHKALKYQNLPTFQRLTSLVSILADMYVANNNEEVSIGTGIYTRVHSELTFLWHSYTELATRENDLLIWHEACTNTTRYRDGFTALTLSYFSAAHILLAVQSAQLIATCSEVPDHHGRILHIAAYLRTREIGTVYLRLAAPLLLVALLAPRAEQRCQAIGYFEAWKGRMGGISALALECVQRRKAFPRLYRERGDRLDSLSGVVSSA